MSYTLSAEIERRIHEHLALGTYASTDDLLLDALSALDERLEDMAAIRAGIEDMEAGRVRPLEDVDAEIRAKHGFPADK